MMNLLLFKSFPKPVFNTLVSVGMLVIIVLVLQMKRNPNNAPETLMMREVDIAPLTIPPPPPPSTQPSPTQNNTPQLVLATNSSGASLKVSTMDVPLPMIIAPQISDPNQSNLQVEFNAPTTDTIAEIQTFGLEQLDQYPRLLTQITARLPSEIAAKKIKKLKITLHIIIHENGRVELKGTKDLPYPQLVSVAEKIVRQARFTSPTRHGEKVKAEFYWPVNVKA
ncbi:hypothetical protein ACFOD0_12835 [Shewanella intestini]|uniref:TonB C-terminal domain-containing protein n=1 Tax=Shewanella intestini TaxID=2017544 RepID=A0ABS5I051_9GAMM|nr:MULTISPECIES: hypothetical protein [Shewanella]MBR9727396.1 hypothetical protein [Shewanella intestini]MRG35554.1 hypothetical protein [Shewanella sp. XMDDZSB0408]